MTAASPHTIRLGTRRYPLILPSWADPRLHTAAVIVSIHIIGVTALGFRVSVPQILSAIVTAALADVVITLWRTGEVAWPASGMLTGSGVALILRLVTAESGDPWSWSGWHYFALVAGLSVATKYFLRFRDSHLFNPSNIGLVVTFLVLGSGVVEPLDFWWAPLDIWMTLAYVTIIGGGILITRRLRLLEMAVVFWVVLSGGLGVLTASGHCMAATWSLDPVCGSRFWWILVTSPEILIFLLFMITDPKTIPTGRIARVGFAATLAVLATLLIAPHGLEFGAKVGLLASLMVLNPIRGLFERLSPYVVAEDTKRREHRMLRVAGVTVALLVVAAAIVAAGAPARRPTGSTPGADDVIVDFDPETLPEVTVDPEVSTLSGDLDAEGLAVTLAENLLIEREAVLRSEPNMLAVATAGDRLVEMRERITTAIAAGEKEVTEYTFDTLTLGLADAERDQGGAQLAFEGTGSLDVVTYDADGVETARKMSPFSLSFALRQVDGDRWLITDIASVSG